MNPILIIVLTYAYIHYGTMLLFVALGVYQGNRKELLMDLIPFRWVYNEFKNIFAKKKSE